MYFLLLLHYNSLSKMSEQGERKTMEYADIRFPHLGIVFSHVGQYIQIGNFKIMYYGIVIAIGFLLGLLVTRLEAKKTGQDVDVYLDYFLYMVIPAIIGARLYYVIFSWDYYKKHPIEILLFRNGGLGIVGGISMAVFVMFLFCKKRKYSFPLMLDTVVMGTLIGQILGRWGNFFNREAFGSYTDGILAMQIPAGYFERMGRTSELQSAGLMDHLVNVVIQGKSIPYIQVHPTFLYEGLWNLLILIFVFLYRKHKKFDGELLCIYLVGYGFGRFFIESLRTDQLLIGHTGIAATQVVCIFLFIGGIAGIISGRRKHHLAQSR